MIVIKLNCSKIPKERLFAGKSGKLIDLVLMENKDGPDQYGNDGFVSVSISKEERAAGERGAIVGNWRHVGAKPAQKPAAPARPAAKPTSAPPDDDDFS